MPRRRSWLRRFVLLIGIGFALIGVAAIVGRVGPNGMMSVGLGPAVGDGIAPAKCWPKTPVIAPSWAMPLVQTTMKPPPGSNATAGMNCPDAV